MKVMIKYFIVKHVKTKIILNSDGSKTIIKKIKHDPVTKKTVIYNLDGSKTVRKVKPNGDIVTKTIVPACILL